MDRYERLKKKLSNREPIIGTHFHMINSPAMIEKIDQPWLDFFLLDTEHGVFSNEGITNMLQVMRLIGLPSVVRVPVPEYQCIARAIDLGADGILIPRTETLEQVKTAIGAMRFTPRGVTGHGGYIQMRPGETYDEFQNNRMLFVQIESPKGIDNLPAMLEQYGKEIAGIIIGPYDLSSTMGMFKRFDDPVFIANVKKTFDIGISHGKTVGIFCDNKEQAAKYRALGANLLWMCTEEEMYIAGMNAELRPFVESC